MPNDHEAAEAIAGLDGKELGGRNLKVNEARPKDERPRAVIAVADAPVVVAATADSRMRITASPPAGRANRAGNPITLNELSVALLLRKPMSIKFKAPEGNEAAGKATG